MYVFFAKNLSVCFFCYPEERKRSGERAVQYVKRHDDREIVKGKLAKLLLE